MIAFRTLVWRNCKLFFKDKGTFFSSLIAPIILLVLYATFLYNVYEDNFLSALPEGMDVPGEVIAGTVGSFLFSSLLAVSTVTVSFSANLFLVQDKATGVRTDFTVSPVKRSTLALSYYCSTVLTAMLISLLATAACFLYLSFTGWYFTVSGILWILLDELLLVLFGTALSSIFFYFLSTQGQQSAALTIVSAGYGFLCGAYMPISQFGEGLQNVLHLFPGTYGTTLLRSHAMQGVFAEMDRIGFPADAIGGMKRTLDCEITFGGTTVSTISMYAVFCGTILALIAVYVLLNKFGRKAKR